MNKKVKYSLFFSLLFTLALGSGWLTYRGLVGDNNNIEETLQTNVIKTQSIKDLREANEYVHAEKTTDKTLFVFKKNSENKETETTTRLIPQEFVGLTKVELAENYTDWEIIGFNDKLVEFERSLEEHEPMYVLSTDEDELVIYYKDENGNISVDEKLGIYIENLPSTDVENIRKGIVYERKEDIMKVLENFDS